MEKQYIAIDLKSFYASVECVERGLDPLNTNLVVADPTRTEKTICLAVSPSLKAHGISGRARLFEAVQQVKLANSFRLQYLPHRKFSGSSCFDDELKADKTLAIDYIVAPPRMALYMEYSTRIYDIYLRHVAPEDIHVYSVDEVFIDVTSYLKTRKTTAHDFARMLISEVLRETGITATAGIGTNLYLAKIAMDIVAKHIPADKDGVRIAELDERGYRQQLWNHRPLTDFWRVGRGYSKKLEAHGIYTMGDVARCSLNNEELLYKLFGINAELLIDHAWGWEPCGMKEIKSYKPSTNSLSSGQVLQCPYSFENARLIVKEMTDLLVLDLVEKGLVTDQMVLTVGYDIENLADPALYEGYNGEIVADHYGRLVPKSAHGTVTLKEYSSSGRLIMKEVTDLYDRIMDKNLLVRRITVAACRLITEEQAARLSSAPQMELFGTSDAEKEQAAASREKDMQKAMLKIKNKFGKNAVFRGMNLEEGATAKDRNRQIGGHKA